MPRYNDDDDSGADFPDSKVIRVTELAIFCEIPMGKGKPSRTLWIPKANIHDDSEVFDAEDNKEGRLVLKTWWAEQEGLL